MQMPFIVLSQPCDPSSHAWRVGIDEGNVVGTLVIGDVLGAALGPLVGSVVGFLVGADVGTVVGVDVDGAVVVGARVGAALGFDVGGSVVVTPISMFLMSTDASFPAQVRNSSPSLTWGTTYSNIR